MLTDAIIIEGNLDPIHAGFSWRLRINGTTTPGEIDATPKAKRYDHALGRRNSRRENLESQTASKRIGTTPTKNTDVAFSLNTLSFRDKPALATTAVSERVHSIEVQVCGISTTKNGKTFRTSMPDINIPNIEGYFNFAAK
jgi:hypothetical protein